MTVEGRRTVQIKEELHGLVDELHGDRATVALVYLHWLRDTGEGSNDVSATQDDRNLGPSAVSGRAFFAQGKTDLRTLATQQGVQPVENFDRLLGNFWPEDETADDLIAAVRRWRREDTHG